MGDAAPILMVVIAFCDGKIRVSPKGNILDGLQGNINGFGMPLPLPVETSELELSEIFFVIPSGCSDVLVKKFDCSVDLAGVGVLVREAEEKARSGTAARAKIFFVEDIEVPRDRAIGSRFTKVYDNDLFDTNGGARDARDENFMNASDPMEETFIANAAFAPKLTGGIAELIATDDIFPIEGLHIARSGFDGLPDAVGVENHVVGINPEDPITGGAIKGLLASMRKISAPRCVENPVGILTSDSLGGVGRSGVDDDDFVDVIANAGEATRQGTLLILYDQRCGDFHANHLLLLY
jgi:hypothetical protein